MSTRVVVPQIGQSIAEATIVKWFKKPGESIEKGETLVEIGTDKINTEIPAPESGVVRELLVQEGETVPVQTEIAVIESSSIARPSVPVVAAEEQSSGSQGRLPHDEFSPQKYSPVVRRLAQENNVDLTKIMGSGEGGRVTKDDVLKAIETKNASARVKISDSSTEEEEKAVPMSRMRKLIADHMIRSKRSTAELTTIFEIDMTEVSMQREEAKEVYQKQGLKLTYLPFVISAVCKALRAFPIVNSSIEAENIVYKQRCNIGIATVVDEGLIVPVIRNADEKNVLGISRATSVLADRARKHELSPDDMTGGTFTITNPGAFGALMGTPIINYPQVAILGVGAVETRAVVISHAVVIRSMAYFSLTYDHRAMDGAVADAFMAHIKRALENECPSALE